MKRYRVLVIDPPWLAGKGGRHNARPSIKQQTMDYNMLSIDDIFSIIDSMLLKCDETHNVFLWCIDRMLTPAEERMKNRGYKLHARIIWDKGRGLSPCYTVRFTHEYLLWFFKPGHMLKPLPTMRGVYSDVFKASPREHSRKPDEAYTMIDNMFGDCAKLDVFSREHRKGWDTWGNETTKFDEQG